MFAVIKIHLTNGTMEAYGPFQDKRNAAKACRWHDSNPTWYASVVPLTRPIDPAEASNGKIVLTHIEEHAP